MLRQEIQGGAAARHAKRLALWAELARPRHLSALHMWTAPSSQGYLGSALIRSLASICSACFRART